MTDTKEQAITGVSIRTFDGAGSKDQQDLHRPMSTPDCNGAASHNYFVEFINNVFSIYDKNSGSLVGSRVTDTQFWQRAGIAKPANIVDPRIVFIPDAGRNGQWLAVELNLGYRVLMATTDPGDPTADPSLGKWKASVFDLPGNDFTMLGYDQSGIYIGTNSEVAPSTPPPPERRSPQVVFIPRTAALAWPPQLDGTVTIVGPMHYVEYGDSLYPAIDGGPAAWPYGTLIGIDNETCRHLTFSLFSPQTRDIVSHGQIEVEPFTPVPAGYRVKQPEAVGVGMVPWYNDGIIAAPMSDGFNIWLTQTVLNKGGSLAVRWYRLSIDPVTRIPGLAYWTELSKVGFDYFNPSILSFGKDDYTIVAFSRSGNFSTSRNPSDSRCGNIGAYAAIMRETDAEPAIFTLKSGQAPDYVPPGAQRWGDYSTICRDHDRGARRAWVVNQCVERGGGKPDLAQWRNIIAAIDLP